VTASAAIDLLEVEPLELDVLLGGGARTITVAASRDPNAKVTVLVFESGGTVATLVVKIPTTTVAASAIEAEARALNQVRVRLRGDLLETVPRVVDLVPSEHGRALVTCAQPGVPMTTPYHWWHHVSRRRAVVHDFDLAARWLTRLQHVTASDVRPVDFVGPLAKRLEVRFGGAPLLGRVLEHLETIDRRLRRSVCPSTVVHGDYWAGNLLTDGVQISGVVDWEAAAAEGSPLRDVARFPLAYALYLDRHTRPGTNVAGHPGLRAGSWGAGLRYAIDGEGWFPRLLRDCVGSHLERLGVPSERWRDIMLAGVADCAATADQDEFARRQFDLLAALCCSSRRASPC
jgi:hypothetical protein